MSPKALKTSPICSHWTKTYLSHLSVIMLPEVSSCFVNFRNQWFCKIWSVTRLDDFLKLTAKNSFKSSLNAKWPLGYFKNISSLVKTTVTTIWATFGDFFGCLLFQYLVTMKIWRLIFDNTFPCTEEGNWYKRINCLRRSQL